VIYHLAVALVFAAWVFGSAAAAQMGFYSHRGESLDAPENTMAAFNLSLARGADGFECDVYLTLDRHLVCIHDSTTGRVTGQVANLDVTNSTLSQLRALDVGAWKGQEFVGERIPLLSEVFDLARDGCKILVEIKQSAASGVVPLIRDAVRAHPRATPERIAFISFKADAVSAIREALPKYEAFWLGYYSFYANNSTKLIDLLRGMNASGFDGYYHDGVIGAGIVDALHLAGFSAHVWTVDNADPAIFCRQVGMDSLTSNRAGMMKDHVYSAQIPPSWLEQYPALLASAGNDYRMAGMSRTGKFDGYGREMSVWEDYVAGTCPTNPASQFRCFIGMESGAPVLAWDPDLGGERVYTLWGKPDLSSVWTTPTNAASRFFRVGVSLP
jgi:glycerophosphoryl diester phosphodiesterase